MRLLAALRWRGLGLARRFYERQEWLRIRHEPRADPPPAPPLPAGCRVLQGEELRLGYRRHAARNRRIEQRLADARQLGLGVADADGLLYDTWLWRGSYDEPNTGLHLDPGPGGGVLLDSWTDPERRGLGLHGAMLARRLAAAAGLGLAPLDGLVHARNRPALRAQRAAGARLLERLVIRRVLGWRWTRSFKVEWHELDLD
ncbi:MAG: hypothetical protein WC326_00675 [Candidatus Delongbacteria bacterium]